MATRITRRWSLAALVAGTMIFSAVACAAESPELSAEESALMVPIAQSVIENRVNALIAEAKPDSLNGQEFSDELRRTESQVIDELNAAQYKSRAQGIAYTHGETDLKVLTSRMEGSLAVLVMNEHTKLYYDVSAGQGAPESTEWSVDREFTFETAQGTPQLISQQVVQPKGISTDIDPVL